MEIQRIFSVFTIQLVILARVLDIANAEGLKLGFYKEKCRAAKDIVKEATAHFISRAPTLAAAVLRMHFHDCFVRGCDGSILLNSPNNQAEKDAYPNLTLRGFQVIDAAKSALEEKCPGVVSCADILALVARDAVGMVNGPYWDVPLGRRDGKVSSLEEAMVNLPSPFANISSLKASFQSKGLNAKDLVVLSGAHTIGIGHCYIISDRLYNFTGKGDIDPTLDPSYAASLMIKCKVGDTHSFVQMDPGSSKVFDKDYYTVVNKKKGLFQSDAALLDDKETKAYVKLQASSGGSTFFKDFAKSMVKLGKLGVLTGKDGEIRRTCALLIRVFVVFFSFFEDCCSNCEVNFNKH